MLATVILYELVQLIVITGIADSFDVDCFHFSKVGAKVRH